MKQVPLTAIANQTLNVVLGNQSCKVNVQQKSTGLFLDLFVSDSPIVTTVLCHDRVRLVRDGYLGFVGDLMFVDMQGVSDPDYTELGSRFVLIYLEASDL
jgi:hypothetical protein